MVDTPKKVEKLEKKVEKVEQAVLDEKEKNKKLEKELEEESKKNRILNKAKSSAHELKNEIKKSTNTAIVAAFSFLIALAWKDVITSWVDTLIGTELKGYFLGAIIVTLICVVGIVITTKLLSVDK